MAVNQYAISFAFFAFVFAITSGSFFALEKNNDYGYPRTYEYHEKLGRNCIHYLFLSIFSIGVTIWFLINEKMNIDPYYALEHFSDMIIHLFLFALIIFTYMDHCNGPIKCGPAYVEFNIYEERNAPFNRPWIYSFFLVGILDFLFQYPF